MVERGTVLPAKVDDLQVELVPGLPGEDALQVFFDVIGGLAVGEPPTPRQPQDVGVDRERRDTEGLGPHHVCGLAPDAWQRAHKRPGEHGWSGLPPTFTGRP